MKLGLELIKEIAMGVAVVKQENGNIILNRFNSAQEELYRVRDEAFYKKTFSTAGVRLSFETDIKSLFLKNS